MFVAIVVPYQGYAEDAVSDSEQGVKTESVRIYRSPEERREAGLGKQITEWLKLGGVIELEKEWKNNKIRGRDNTEDPDTELAVEMGFEVDYHDWLEAEVLFAIEDNGRRHFQEVDEALIGVNIGELGLKIGWLYVPFGTFYSHFVTDPLLEFGQTRGATFLMDYTLWDTVELAGYIFDSEVDKHRDRNELDWGISVEYVSEDESTRLGGGYISDLAESEEGLLLEFNEMFLRRVPAWNAYGMFGIPPFEFTAEVVRAIRTFKEFPENANQPFAYNFEIAYFPFNFIQFAIRAEHSEEFDGEPAWQYGITTTVAPLENLTLSADYLYGRYKKGFVLDDFDNRQTAHHFTALQLTWGF